MGLVDSVLREIEIASGARWEIETEADARRRAQYAAAMEVPAVERIVQVAVGGVVAERETASGCWSLGPRRTSGEPEARR